MTKKAMYPFVCLVLLTALVSPAVAEDLTIVSTVTTGKGKPVTSTQYISENQLRTSDGRFDTIMDIESGRIIHIDHKKKTYSTTTLEESRAHFAEVEQMLNDNPFMAKMLGGAATAEVEKGTETRQVAGYDCEQWFLTVGKAIKLEMFVTPDLKVPTDYYDAQKMAYAAMGPTASRFDKLYEEMKKIDGVALWTKLDTKAVGIKLKSISEATEVRKGTIPADAFEPPAGYKSKGSPYGKKKK